MPFPWIAAAATGGSFLNSIGQARENRRSRNFSREMYQRQVDDNISFWNMQNNYNSPQEQMKRFQEAGLNPALMYKQGSAGNAGSISSASAPSAQFQNPRYGDAVQSTVSMLSQIADLDIKKQQANNLAADNTIKQQEALLKEAQVANTRAGTDRSVFDLGLDTELRDISAEYRREQLRQLKVGTDISLNDDERRAAMNSSNLLEASERILNMRISRAKSKEEIRNLKAQRAGIYSDNRLKQLNAALAELGITFRDPLYQRIVALAVTDPSNAAFRKITNRLDGMFGGDKFDNVRKSISDLPKRFYNSLVPRWLR